MMRRKWLFILVAPLALVFLQGCGKNNPLAFFQPSYEPQAECGFVQNVYGQRISWKGITPVRLQVHQSFPADYMGALQNAILKWEQRTGRPLFQITATNVAGPLEPRQDGSNIIYFMNTWEDNRAQEQARTSIYWVGDSIQEADLRINAKNFNFYWQSPKSPSDVHIESILVHELGHMLGLKHNDSVPSVMATYLAALTVRENISSTDDNNLRCEY